MKSRRFRGVLLLCLLPLLAALALMWALPQRTVEIERVKAAVVNLDSGVEMEINGQRQTVPLGRQIIAELTKPHVHGYDWEIVTEKTAQAGLTNGKYVAVVTIPPDFSKQLTSMGTESATPAIITVTTGNNSLLTQNLSPELTQAATRALGKSVTKEMLGRIYLGFTQQKEGLAKAAQGANQLAGGIEQLGDGTRQAAAGSGELVQGQQRFNSGLQQYLQGIAAADNGANQLAEGLNTGASGAASFANGMQRFRNGFVGTASEDGLISGIEQLQIGITGSGNQPGLATGAKSLAAGLNQLADQLTRLEGQLSPYRDDVPSPAQLRELATKLRTLAGRWEQVQQRWEKASGHGDEIATVIAFLEDCPPATSPQRCARAKELAQQLAQLELEPQLRSEIDALVAQLQQVSSELSKTLNLTHVADIVDQLSQLDSALYGDHQQPGLFQGVRQLAAGADQLALGISGAPGKPGLTQGVQQLLQGARQLETALDGGPNQPGLVQAAQQLAGGFQASAQGAQQLASGLSQANAHSSQLSEGGSQLVSGTQQLQNGLTQLDTGVDKLHSGAKELARGLDAGAKAIPSYTQQQRDRIIAMALTPVQAQQLKPVNSSEVNTLFPGIAALALWLGAFMAFLLLPALRPQALAAPVSANTVMLRSVIPALLIGLVQALLLGIVSLACDVSFVSQSYGVVVLVLGAVAIAIITQALIAFFGDRLGSFIVLLIAVLQFAAAPGILPLASAPGTFQAMYQLLPPALVSTGLKEAITGGNANGIVGVFVPLALWLILALLALRAAVPRARKRLAYAKRELH